MRNALGRVDSVLLLGGRSEIGLAVVKRLVREGASKVVLAARPGAAPTVVAPEVHVVDFDAARPETHAEVVATAAKLVGDLDVVISAFGVLGNQAVYDEDPLAAAESMTVNLTGHVSADLAAARLLRQQGHGTLVVLSSMAGYRVRRANFVYGAAKAGLDGFAQGLGDALHGTGARVMIVRPGFVIGRMTSGMDPAPFSSTVDQVADAVIAGLRADRDIVWVPPMLRWIFGVMRLLPRAIWRRMPR